MIRQSCTRAATINLDRRGITYEADFEKKLRKSRFVVIANTCKLGLYLLRHLLTTETTPAEQR